MTSTGPDGCFNADRLDVERVRTRCIGTRQIRINDKPGTVFGRNQRGISRGHDASSAERRAETAERMENGAGKPSRDRKGAEEPSPERKRAGK